VSPLILLLSALAAPGDVTAVTLNGQQHSGILKVWDEQGLVLVDGSGSEERIATDQLQRVARAETAAAATVAPPVTITLVDGSVYHSPYFQIQQGSVRTGLGGPVPATALRSVRWKDLTGDALQQWQQIAERQHTTDAVVVQRPSGALDYVGGIVGDITDQHIQFEFNSQSVQLPRERAAGLVYSSTSRQFPRPRLRLRTTAGDQWNVDTLTVRQGRVQAQSQAGLEVTLSWEEVEQIEVMTAAFTHLSDLEPLRSEWQPYWSTAADATDPLFAPAKDTSLLSGPLLLRVERRPSTWQSFSKGLSLHSRSELEYLLKGKFRRLTAWAGLDPRLAHPGSVKLAMWADDRLVYEQVIEDADSAARIDVDLSGAQRLRLLVDYHDRQDLGDYLNLCDAKLWE
jgi:hypothetical protein